MEEHIPQQIEGKSLDCFKTVDFSTQGQADVFFEQVKDELLDVNNYLKILR